MQDNFQTELELYERYRQALVAAKREAERAEAEVEKYRLAVNGLRAVIPDELLAERGQSADEGATDEPSNQPRGPRGEAAVRALLEEHPNRGFKASELTQALIERGQIGPVKHPESTTRQAANRLRRKDERFRFEDGKYVFRPVPPSGGNPFAEAAA